MERRIKEYKERVDTLNEPYYANAKSAKITCKKCTSSIATAYCGRPFCYTNKCPVCGSELRPESVVEKLNKYKDTICILQKQLKEEYKKVNEKLAKTSKEEKWLVMAQVHC